MPPQSWVQGVITEMDVTRRDPTSSRVPLAVMISPKLAAHGKRHGKGVLCQALVCYGIVLW